VRLAFLTHEPFFPPSGGGSAEAVYLVEEFVRRGHEVHVFGPALADADSVAARMNIRIHGFTGWGMGRYTSLRTPKYLLYPFALARMVGREAARTKFDLLLSQHTISAVAAGRLKRTLRVPVVMNFLDYLTGFMETWPAWTAPRPLVRALMRFELSLPSRYQADGIMTVSDPLADCFADAGCPRGRILPIYYGYDSERFKPLEPGAPAPDHPVVVMHGSFDQHHLQAIAREAVLRVTAARPQVEFKFLGRETATLRSFLGTVRAAAPRANLTTTGFVPYADVAEHLASATVGIVPYEASRGTHCAFVAKVVEYLGTGIPAVCTPLENVRRRFAAEPAVKFSGFDGASFGDAILAWLDTRAAERAAVGLAASERVKASLDWRVLASNAATFVEGVHASASAHAPPAANQTPSAVSS
jgi:glycosyltransferase involved in cell wall biosynthesis